MTEIDRVRAEIEHAFDGEPWCGPSLLAALAGVTSERAARQVPGLTHSIGAIVLHVAGWQAVVARRLSGEAVVEPKGGEWPAFDGDWHEARRRLDTSHKAILDAIHRFDPDRLDDKIGDSRHPEMGSGMSAYATLHGVAQHAMYHAGQIALLKKLVSTP